MMRTLYTKLAVTTISIMIVSSFLAFMMANFYYQQKLKPENDAKNTAIAEDVASFIEDNNSVELDEYLNHIATIGYQLYLVNEDGEKTYYGDKFRKENLSDTTIETVLSGQVYHGMANLEQETFVTGFFSNELKNTIGVPFTYEGNDFALFLRPNIKLLFNEIHILLAWLLLGMLVLSIIFVLISTKFLVKPITVLDKATQELAEGNFAIKLDIDRNDELGQLAESFTHMTKQLEKLDEIKSEFIGNVSHDIQTPLSTIKGYTDLLKNESLPKEEKEKYITIIHDEVTRLSALTKQLLVLATIDRTDDSMIRKPFSLSDQLKQVIIRNQYAIDEKGIMVSFDLGQVMIEADETLLYNVWENLLHNAIKYNVDHGSIDIKVIEKEDELIVRIEDSGIGMDAQSLDRVFERFYRVDSARTRDVQGSGLGLSIVKRVLQLHGGRIAFESVKDKGTICRVHLPLK